MMGKKTTLASSAKYAVGKGRHGYQEGKAACRYIA